MKHKCKNHSVCGGWVRHGDLCDDCKKAIEALNKSWQTIEQDWQKVEKQYQKGGTK